MRHGKSPKHPQAVPSRFTLKNRMITTPSQLLSVAIDMGNMTFAKIIANSLEYRAEIEAAAIAFHNRPKAPIETTAADNASKLSGFDFERAILVRDEPLLHSI